LSHAVRKIGSIQRGDCRAHVLENFTKEKMVEGYEQVYKEILSNKR